MKSLKIILIIIISLIFTSCSQVNEEIISDNDGYTTVEIVIPTSEDFRTRSFGDGLAVSTLKCYAYCTSKATGNEPDVVNDIPIHVYSDHIGAFYNLSLPKFQSYDLVFIATSSTQNNTDGKIYYNQAQRTINLNYDKIGPNDEDLDCFWGIIKNISPDNSQTYKVSLKRPYAQLNIGTKDLADYNEMSSSTIQSVAIGINGVYTSMNVMDGSVKGKTNLSFSHAPLLYGEHFPVSGNDYLSMNYFLVNENEDHDVVMDIKNLSTSSDVKLTKVPLKRNYRTNIYGNLLTRVNEYKIEINNLYSGNQDSYIGYDLILTLADNWRTGGMPPTIYYKENSYSGYKSVNLSSYVDSNNTIKITWEQIGISSAYSIMFQKDGLNWYSEQPTLITSIQKLKINSLGIRSFEKLFYACRDLTYADLSELKSSDIVDMSLMFFECRSLETLDLSNFDTRNVTNMQSMFDFCWNLRSLNISSFDTSNVNNMSQMFTSCNALEALDVSSFDTSNVTTMRHMFSDCKSLTYLDLSNFDTRNVTNMQRMFSGCESLTYLVISNFDYSSVTKMESMLDDCPATIY